MRGKCRTLGCAPRVARANSRRHGGNSRRTRRLKSGGRGQETRGEEGREVGAGREAVSSTSLLVERERRARFAERVFDKKLFEALPEKDLIAESMEALIVVLENGINPFQGLAHRVFAEVVVERLEIEEIDATERASGLVAVFGGRGIFSGPQRRDEIHMGEAVEAFVEDLRRNFEEIAELGGRDGRQAGLETAANGEQDDERQAFAHRFGELAPRGLTVAEVDVLNGVTDDSAD